MEQGGTESDQVNGRQTRPADASQPTPQQAPAMPPPPYYGAPPQEYQPVQQQPAYQQPAYQQPVYGAVPGVPGPKTNGMAVASLVLGIVSWIPFLWIGFIPGLILGFVGKSQIDRSGGEQGGGGLAVAGIVLGLIGSAILGLFVLLFIFGALGGA